MDLNGGTVNLKQQMEIQDNACSEHRVFKWSRKGVNAYYSSTDFTRDANDAFLKI